jgi:phospholipid/cholesterol/gamma-HCH transport system ATP-binding protein
MTQQPVIQVKNLVARFGDQIILDNISFDVFKGEIVSIIGTSGSGKSTLLRHLIGLNRPYSGQILIENTDIADCDAATQQAMFRHMGVLFQGGALFGSMTLAENVALPMLEYTDLPKDVIARLVFMKLCQFDLAAYPDYMPAQLSGGMRKRAGLARAMALNPKLLFLDEPTSGLDPIKSTEINNLIQDINQNSQTTIIIVTHELKTIFNISNRILMIDKVTKRLIAAGDPGKLAANSKHPTVKQFLNNGHT